MIDFKQFLNTLQKRVTLLQDNLQLRRNLRQEILSPLLGMELIAAVFETVWLTLIGSLQTRWTKIGMT
jgi:hypothetical protein